MGKHWCYGFSNRPDGSYTQRSSTNILLKGNTVKENNEVVSAKTKENKIQEVKQAIEKVAEKKTYKLGDEVKAYGKNCKIVEVLDVDRYHLKNLQEPYDSFVALVEEFE